MQRSTQPERMFRQQWKSIITQLRNHPGICVWVLFNKSRSRFKTSEEIHDKLSSTVTPVEAKTSKQKDIPQYAR